MPAEWAPHEGTLMAWPTRREVWGDQLAQAKADYAATANAVAAFEPLTMVCANAREAAEARAALTGDAEIVEFAIDDSWLRDSGPIFVLDDEGHRAGVHFGFNSWGERFAPWDDDAAVGRLLVDRLGDRRYDAPFVLEGGSVAVDGAGLLLTTEQCLLNPNRNPHLSREEIEQLLCDYLGVETVVWLGQGLVEDRDTDGHVDLIAAFTPSGEVLLQSVAPGEPSHERMADNRTRLQAAGLDVVDFPVLPSVEVAGEQVAVSHLNLYLCNGGVVVPVAGVPSDAEALERIGAAYPEREVVGVPGGVIAFGGGGPHCITQQVPAAG
ncbi:MAG TPA: agmatine deiminase family protein [Solirubrobacteraceae bacterium]